MVVTAVATIVVIAALATAAIVLNVQHADATPVRNKGRGYNTEEYMAARQRLLSKEQKRALGAELQLNKNELQLNNILLKVSQVEDPDLRLIILKLIIRSKETFCFKFCGNGFRASFYIPYLCTTILNKALNRFVVDILVFCSRSV